MNSFALINAKNTNVQCDESCANPCTKICNGMNGQLWGVVLSELTEMGSQWSFGVALNESLLVTVVIPDDHNYLDKLKAHSEEFIGQFLKK